MTPSDSLFNDLAAINEAAAGVSSSDQVAADTLYRRLTRKQRAVVDDPARAKSVRCPRRAGKTYVVLHYAFIVALRKPGARVAIVNLTLKNAKRLYWSILKAIDLEFGLNCKFHETNLDVRFPNGSYLFVSGAETVSEIEKLRGDRYDLVIVDECKSFSDRIFQELLDEVITPALLDRLGTKVIIGTPGTILAGEFYRATNHAARVHRDKTDKRGRLVSWAYGEPPPGEKFKWSFHRWTTQDNAEDTANTDVAQQQFRTIWEGALEEKELNGWSDISPHWMREYLGEWVASDSELVFAYAELTGREDFVTWHRDMKSGNTFGLPAGHDWRYVLGMDLGFQDDTAMVVLAYAETSLRAYAVWDYKSPHLTISDVVSAVRAIQKRVGSFDAIVADAAGLGLTIVETLNQEHGLPVDKADKREKFDHVELCNSDFHDGKLLILPESDLGRELECLQWDLSAGSKYELARINKLRYAPGCADHLSDAFLYAWRHLHHHFSEARAPKLDETDPKELSRAEKAAAIAARASETDWLRAYVDLYEPKQGTSHERNRN